MTPQTLWDTNLRWSSWAPAGYGLRGRGGNLTLKTGQLTPSWAGDEAMGLTQVGNEKLDTTWLKQEGSDVA